VGNINIIASDRNNNVSTIQIPFIKYKKPTIQLLDVQGNYVLLGDNYVIFGRVVFKFKITSVIGLSKVIYEINGNKQEIALNGEKDYELVIEINND
jgi:hypothetical protein